MTTSTNGQICYGVLFQEDFEFPWHSEDDNDLEGWWRRVNGYKPLFEMFTEEGRWIGGKEWPQEKRTEYYDHLFAWQKSHPVPIVDVNYCSGDYPMYILACPSSFVSASRGFPKMFSPLDLKVVFEEGKALVEFCHHYLGIDKPEPHWYLSSLLM